MRGTLHLLSAADYPLWQATFNTYRHYLQPVWLRSYEITSDEVEQLIGGIERALEDRHLTRNELADAVAHVTGSPKLGQKVLHSWGSMLKPAAFRGKLCFAPSSGQNVRFTRPDRWLPAWEAVDPASASLEVLRRYLTAFGPATPEEYARWLGRSAAQCKRALKELGEEVIQVDVEGTRAWALARHARDMAQASPGGWVRLLPAFDQYVLAAGRDAPAILAPHFKARVYRNQGWISPVLLVDGRMLGVWRHERKGSRLRIEVEPFEDLTRHVRERTQLEAERLAGFVDGALDFAWVSRAGS
jgi:hypothetical protein